MLEHNQTVRLIDRDTEISKCLSQYLYDHVNCLPYSEYRHNFELFPIFQTSKSNIVKISNLSIRLPASGRWFLYSVENNAIADINFPKKSEKWINAVDYCNKTKVDLRFVIKESSKLIPRGMIYMIKNPNLDNWIIAINKAAISNLADSNGFDDKYRVIHLNIYYHHDDEYFQIIPFVDNSRNSYRNNFYNEIIKITEYPKQVFIDGQEITTTDEDGKQLVNIADITYTCMGEVVYDSAIIGSFETEFSPAEINTYKDDRRNSISLCHIPKKFNLKNEILSHRVCDVYIHGTAAQGSDVYKYCRYVDRLDTDDKFITVTHNDFGINNSFILGLLQDKNIPLDSGLVKIVVRSHNKGIYLDRDPNHILSLYQLDDDLIKSHLLGSEHIAFWSASKISASQWAYCMDHFVDKQSVDNLPRLIAANGYVLSASAVCDRVFNILITNEMGRKFYVPIPICYLRQDNLRAHVFIDGLLLDKDEVRFHKENQFLVLDFTRKAILKKGKTITVELFEDVPYKYRKVTLQPGETVVVSVDQEYLVYKEIPLSNENEVDKKLLYKRFSCNTSYRELTESEYSQYTAESHKDDSTLWVAIKAGSSSETFIIVSKHAYSKLYGVERHMKELNYDIWCTHLLTVKARRFNLVVNGEVQPEASDLDTIPYLNSNDPLLVYFNGRELIKGLDYEEYSIKTTKGYNCGRFAILQNADYIRLASNTIEVFCVNEERVAYDTGFLTDTTSDTILSHLNYYKNIGAIFTDGRIVPNHKLEDYYVDVCKARKGSSYKIRAYIPRCLKSLIDLYAARSETTIRTVNEYLTSILPSPLIVTPITRSYHIYSVYIQYITEQVLRGYIKVNRDWTDNNIKAILDQYKDVMEFDLAFSNKNIEITDKTQFTKTPKSGLDYRFVDVLPSYRLEKLEDDDLTIVEKRPIMIISGSNNPDTNDNYICMNPGLDYMKDDKARHINIHAYKRWEGQNNSCKIEHSDGCWNLIDPDGLILYTAEDTKGIVDIWNLKWVPVHAALGNIVIDCKWVEVNTSNEFPIHRLQFTYSIAEYEFLQKVANMYIKTDLAKDGMNV